MTFEDLETKELSTVLCSELLEHPIVKYLPSYVSERPRDATFQHTKPCWLHTRPSLPNSSVRTPATTVSGAQVGGFSRPNSNNSPPVNANSKVQLDHKYKVVHAMVRFLYFGGLPMDTLTSLDCLDLLGLADDVEVGTPGVEALRETRPFSG